MNTLAKINVAKMDVAKEILEKIYEINEEKESYWANRQDFFNEITDYIEKEHLFISWI